MTLGGLLDRARVVRFCSRRIPTLRCTFRIGKLAAGVVEGVEVSAGRHRCRGADQDDCARAVHFASTHKCECDSKNAFTARDNPNAILSWKDVVPSSFTSSGCDMNPISTRTAGM